MICGDPATPPHTRTPVNDPDIRLMLRVQEGSLPAFTQLVNTYRERVVSVLYHRVLDQGAAEDLAQEVFIRVYRARHTYQPTARVSTWLFHIASNLASNHRRNKSRRREVSFALAQTGPKDGRTGRSGDSDQVLADVAAPAPDERLEHAELQAVVQAALTTLSDRQRRVLQLHKFEDLTYAEIGARLNMTEAAVKSLLSRAREHLRVKLEPYMKTGVLSSSLQACDP